MDCWNAERHQPAFFGEGGSTQFQKRLNELLVSLEMDPLWGWLKQNRGPHGGSTVVRKHTSDHRKAAQLFCSVGLSRENTILLRDIDVGSSDFRQTRIFHSCDGHMRPLSSLSSFEGSFWNLTEVRRTERTWPQLAAQLQDQPTATEHHPQNRLA